MKSVMKTVLYLFLRVVLVCILAAMSIPISSFFTDVTIPILAIFYFLMIMYFFIFTAWSVGGKDVIADRRLGKKTFQAKGFAAAGVIAVGLAIFYFAPNLVSSLVGQATPVYLVFYFIKLFFVMFSVYPMLWVQSAAAGVALSSTEIGGGVFTSVAATIVFFAIIICCVIGAGVAYIVGYRQIRIVQPWLDKWKR